MSNYSLFSVIGIEIEYMLVDKKTLDIRPMSDRIIQKIAHKIVNEIAIGDIAISNEFVLHVLELKNNGPKPLSTPLAKHFQTAIDYLKPHLDAENLQLLPTGAHPWMNPQTETKRWPHDNHDIYAQYDKIFNCKGHGWSNLQSMHVNLPFANDDEFHRLHNTLRLLLPLLPALAASTPILEGQFTGYLDSRLHVYAKNQEAIPSINGSMIPEFISSQASYEQEILQPMYRDIQNKDPEGLLQYEWLNSRAAIPKFANKALETRIIDTQECVQADIAIARLIPAILQSWLVKSHQHLEQPMDTQTLKNIYDQTIQNGMQTIVSNPILLSQWQLPNRRMNARDIWSMLIESAATRLDQPSQQALEHILNYGNLSERILRACQADFNHSKLAKIYQSLSDCMMNNHLWSVG